MFCVGSLPKGKNYLRVKIYVCEKNLHGSWENLCAAEGGPILWLRRSISSTTIVSWGPETNRG